MFLLMIGSESKINEELLSLDVSFPGFIFHDNDFFDVKVRHKESFHILKTQVYMVPAVTSEQ